MKLNILITGGLYDSQAAYSALQFSKAALDAGHSLLQVFFYHNGVSVANALSAPLADEFDGHLQWLTLAQQYSIPVVVCVSAAERRGVLSSVTQSENGDGVENPDPVFQVVGLGALHEASLASDRTVTFS